MAEMPPLVKSASIPFLSHHHHNFHSTLERLRKESVLCPPIEEEGRLWDTDLEASYFAPILHQPGKQAQPLLGCGQNSFKLTFIDYSHFDGKENRDWAVNESRWHRRTRSSGWMALLLLLAIVFYLSMFKL